MFMSFLNTLPLPLLILLGLAVLGFCDYLKQLYTWGKKIEMFSNYANRLVEFRDDAMADKDIDTEVCLYLLKNSVKIYMDSIIYIKKYHPITGLTTGLIDEIDDIVRLNCSPHNFAERCQRIISMLIMTIGFFENISQEIRSKIFNPIEILKNGVSLIFNGIPIVNLIPTNFKDFLSNLFAFISIVETLLSLFSQKSLILSITRQITEWIS